MHSSLLALIVACNAWYATAQSSCISTIVGVGSDGFNGDGLPATSTSVNLIQSVSMDPVGRIVFADSANRRIRRIELNGTVSTIAGGGTGGDGSFAVAASLSTPYGITVDALGQLFIVDYGAYRVRFVDVRGNISTIAGTSSAGYNGDGIPGTTAKLYFPTDVALDSNGRPLIADRSNNRIRRVEADGIINVVVGNGNNGFNGDSNPATSTSVVYAQGVGVDAWDRVLVADTNNHRIRRVYPNGTVNTIAGTGTAGYNGDGIPATSARLNAPTGVAADASGRVLIADQSNHRIRIIELNGTIFTLAGTGTGGYNGDGIAPTSAQLSNPYHIFVDPLNRVLICDLGNSRLRLIDTVCDFQVLSVDLLVLPPSFVRVYVATNRVGSLTSVSMSGTTCTGLRTIGANTTAVCALPPGGSASLSVVLAGSTIASKTVALPASTVAVAPAGNGSIAWGGNITLLFSFPLSNNVSNVSIFFPPVSVPCLDITVLHAYAVQCTVGVLLESGFSMPVSICITYSEGTTSVMSAQMTNLTFDRPTLLAYAPTVLRAAGGETATFTLPRPISNISICRVPPRAWFGILPSPSCSLLNTSSVACVTPPGTDLFVRVSVELCGTFNVTSDGLAPASPLLGGVENAGFYVSYNPSIFFKDALGAASGQTLHQPAVNLTIPGTGLLALDPFVTSVVIAGSVCPTFAFLDNTSILCYNWVYDPLAGSPVGTASVGLDIQLLFRGQLVPLTSTLPAVHAPQVTTVAPSTVLAGARIAVLGKFFLVGLGIAPNVTVAGSIPCTGISGLSDSSLQCSLPSTIPTYTTGFPNLLVTVTTSAGTSTDVVTVGISIPPSAVFGSAPPLPVLTISSIAQTPVVLIPPPTLTVSGDFPITCVLSPQSKVCPSRIFHYGEVFTALEPDGTLFGALSADFLNASAATQTFSAVGTRLGAGCILNVTAKCSDVNFRSFSPSESFQIEAAIFDMVWQGDAQPINTAPARLSTASNNITGLFTWQLRGSPVSVSWSGLSCTASVIADGTEPPTDISLSQYGAVSTAAGNITVLTSNTASVTFPSLSAEACLLGHFYSIYAECTWQSTAERARILPRPIRIPQISLTVFSYPEASYALDNITVASYANVSLFVGLQVTPLPPSTAIAFNAATCRWQVLSTSVAGVVVKQYPLLEGVVPLDFVRGFSAALEFRAPPGTVVTAQLQCLAYAQTIVSQVVTFAMDDITLKVLSQVPSDFVPSDTSARSPNPLVLAVALAYTSSPAMYINDATCSVSVVTSHPVATFLPPEGMDESSFSNVPASANGVITFPAMDIRASFALQNVSLWVACVRSSGDGPPATTLVVPVAPVRMSVCQPPALTGSAQTELAPFSVSVAPTCGQAPRSDMPPVVCTMQQAVESEASVEPHWITSHSNVTVFLFGTVATVSNGMAVFSGFSLTARPGLTYGLTLSCAIGSTIIPTPLSFGLTLSGCPPGYEPSDMLCQKCAASGVFSLGGSVENGCTACPPLGALCSNGQLTLLPNYYRPPSQSALAFGPDTELHACFNTEACTLNSSSLSYGCATGYTGPLCGVCDEALDYAKFGPACRPCWSRAAAALFVVAAVMLATGLLTRVALRSSQAERTDASILLRITMSHIQAVGALRVFTAGGTKAYRDLMGWTDAVSSSPLSIGAFQCLSRWNFLDQYVAIVLVPFLATAAVVVIFFIATAVKQVPCKGRQTIHTGGSGAQGILTAMRTWLQSRRHVATLLFVLFLAYMPITSASLRVLDCYSPPIDGVRYLRADLSVQCYEGQHEGVRVLAYIMLVLVGLGFPLAVAGVLARAGAQSLKDPSFRGAWGFLYDGYKLPTQDVVSSWFFIPSRSKGVLTSPSNDKSNKGGSSDESGLLWWESVVLVRKAGIVLLAVLVTDPYAQCVGGILWFMAHLQLHVWKHPYARPLFNHLETLSLCASFLTVVISVALLKYNVGAAQDDTEMSSNELLITWLLLLLNLGTVCVLAGCWLLAQGKRVTNVIQTKRGSMRYVAPTSDAKVLTANPLHSPSVRVLLTDTEVVQSQPHDAGLHAADAQPPSDRAARISMLPRAVTRSPR